MWIQNVPWDWLIRTTGTLRDEHEFVQLFSTVITSAFRLSWFVSRSTQTLQNRLPWNLDGGWVLFPNRPHSFLVGIRIKEWIHKPFLTFFNIARSGVFFVVDIFVNISGNDAWILIKKKISGAFRWLVPMSEYNMMGIAPTSRVGRSSFQLRCLCASSRNVGATWTPEKSCIAFYGTERLTVTT